MNITSQNKIITRLKEEKVFRLIQERLPSLFQIAELESSRAGKIGMEVGSIRERIIITLLVSTFRKNNVNVNIPITEPEIDVIVKENPISIKTITSSFNVKAV